MSSRRPLRLGPAGARELLWPPTLAFIAATLVLWCAEVAAGLPAGHFLWGSTWVHWDAGLYESIAQGGYTLMHCAGASTWCGNAGWFPGYPVLLTPIYAIGVTHNGSAVAVSWFFDWATLVLLWGGCLSQMRAEVRHLALLFAAVVPGGIFMRAAFPMSITDFFLIASLLLARRGRWGWAGLLGALASFCYLSAAAWAPVLGGWVLYRSWSLGWTQRLLRAAASAAMVLGGIVAACLLLWAQTGRVDVYFLVQAKYQHGFHDPFENLWNLIHPLFTGVTGVDAAIGVEGLLALAFVLALALTVLVGALRRSLVAWDLVVLALVLVLWLVPLTQDTLDYWRGDTLMLPGVLMFGRVARTPVALLSAGAVAAFPLLALFYFQGTLS